MTEPIIPPNPAMFPTLSPDQAGRVRHHGRPRRLEAGEVIVNPGDQQTPMFLVVAGGLEIVRTSAGGEDLVVSLGPGQFTGEMSLLSGRRVFIRIRATGPAEVIQVEREQLLDMVQTDSDLSGVLMHAFILRRLELMKRDLGDVIVLGSDHCSDTLRVREFLTRNEHPHRYIDLDKAVDVQDLLDGFKVTEEDVPVVICGDSTFLRNPSNSRIAETLGLNEAVDPYPVRDVVVIGAGPAGLAAAVYAASEGLNTLVVEKLAPGGQAGTSSKIENYLGFPMGISGRELAGRAYTQAQKFGAEFLIARHAVKFKCEKSPYVIEIDNGPPVSARAVIIASGAEYRRLDIGNILQFENAGIYYGATSMESSLCHGEDVIVVGGGNSAGQASVFLAEKGSRVHHFVRGDGLRDTMSRYLIRRIDEHPGITMRTHVELTALRGNGHLEGVTWRDKKSGKEESAPIRHVFVMAGAVPNTHWLENCLALDPKGFIKTGSDLTADDLSGCAWPLRRAPMLLETSLPRVFAAGDVRSGNLKRVAPAVGEGSIAVALVHQALADRG